MTHDERRLTRHLAIAVAVKLGVLALLWWVFFSDPRVSVEAETAAGRIGVATPGQGDPQ